MQFDIRPKAAPVDTKTAFTALFAAMHRLSRHDEIAIPLEEVAAMSNGNRSIDSFRTGLYQKFKTTHDVTMSACGFATRTDATHLIIYIK